MLHFDNAECLSERIGAVGSACLVLNASLLSSMQHLLKNKIKMKKKKKELTNCITREQPGLAHTRPGAVAAASSGAVQRGFGAGQGLLTPAGTPRSSLRDMGHTGKAPKASPTPPGNAFLLGPEPLPLVVLCLPTEVFSAPCGETPPVPHGI